MAAMDDLLKDAPGATFLYAIIGKIFTRELMIDDNGYLESANYSEINKTGYLMNASGIKIYNGVIEIGSKVNNVYQGIIIDGVNKEIRSSNFSSQNKTGWKLFPDGSVEFNSGLFRGGGVFGGALAAGSISVTDTAVTAGAGQYLLKSNNNAIILDYSTRGVMDQLPLKVMRTVASGQCVLRLTFPYLSSMNNDGFYMVKVNGVVKNTPTTGNWTGYAVTNAAIIRDITIPLNSGAISGLENVFTQKIGYA